MGFLWRRAWQATPVFLPGESLWTEEPGALQSIGSPRVGHDHTTKCNTAWACQVALVQMQETESLWVQFLHQEGPMEEGVATHCSSFA